MGGVDQMIGVLAAGWYAGASSRASGVVLGRGDVVGVVNSLCW